MDEERMVSKEVLAAMLDARIGPLVETVKRLEKLQETSVEILQSQARQDERVRHLEQEDERHKATHNDMYEKIRACEHASGNKAWDTLKIVLTAVASGGFATLLAQAAK